MEIALKVRRFDPEDERRGPYWQEYAVELDPNLTVLDALIKVREELDETLTLRCSCRSAICGSCAMRINGHAALACKTKLTVATRHGGPVTVEPMGNMAVVKDLVTDLTPFWDKTRAVTPWVKAPQPEPEQEYTAPDEEMLRLVGVMNCIMCGACVSDCTSLEVDPNFLGPAALAKALLAADLMLPPKGAILVSLADRHKAEARPLLRRLGQAGYRIVATAGTAALAGSLGLDVALVARKLEEGHPNVVDIINERLVDAVINTPEGHITATMRDGFYIRRAAAERRIPCFTSLDTARAAIEALLQGAQTYTIQPLRDYLQEPRGLPRPGAQQAHPGGSRNRAGS